MSSLCRTKNGLFSLKESYTLADLEVGNYCLIKMVDVLPFDVVSIDNSDDLFHKVTNGMKLSPNTFSDSKEMVAFACKEDLIAIYQYVATPIPGYHPLRIWK